MIEKFAITSGMESSEFLDLNRTSEAMILVPPYHSEVRSQRGLRTPANFGMGALAVD
jgi:hypothetical protein